MFRGILLGFVFSLCVNFVFSAVIKGKISDAKTGEELVGATVFIKALNVGTLSGLDGTFVFKNIPKGNFILICQYISYQPQEININISDNESITKDILLQPQDTEIEEVNVVAFIDKSTEISARMSERNSDQIMNVVSARTIELSPDLNVASALQRMSGVTLDKSTSGSGQYALIRGMDKRYNYTLVNGIKIPSTHNKHRYVSLDLFPSDMVDRIEVSKTLTADMEGDAIGGAVNLVMKNAPAKFLLQANAAVGYSLFHTENDFYSFNTTVINSESPYERNESGYRAVPDDFSKENLQLKLIEVPVNYFLNLTAGNRFFNQKLGWIISGSYQKTFTGENSLYYDDDLSRDGKNLPVLTEMQQRVYSDQKANAGIHNKFDYQFNRNHSLKLYSAYMDFANTQLREVQKTDLAVSYDPSNGNVNRNHSTRFRYNHQSILNLTLQGDHHLTGKLDVQWSAVYSKANNSTPEEAIITYSNGLEDYNTVRQYVDFDGSTRIWRRNSDQDLAGYLNLTYRPVLFGIPAKINAGGLYRQKDRNSFYNKYTLKAITEKNGTISFYSEKGVDWDTYDEINWQVYNPRGTVAVGENYDAYETVIAGYGMINFTYKKLEFTGGLRVENTDQGYSMLYPVGEPSPDGNQKYTDFLPSGHLKYAFTDKQNLRISYFKATNKPGFQEIVPYIDNSEEPASAGNKDLKHAVGNNIDFRWEFLPSPQDQIMAGVFYKHIKNPIEFAFDKFMNVSQNIVYMPINSDNATNYGFEIDLIKYYREWGIKGNYTFTHSEITTQKLSRIKDENGNDETIYIPQTRPLFGQSPHVGNVSLLYKNADNGISAQLAFSYTGERIYTVSRYIDNDMWQEGFWQLDASAEKTFKNKMSIFIKAQNLLNTHVKVFIKNKNPINDDVSFQDEYSNYTLVRDEYSMASLLIGIRYKF